MYRRKILGLLGGIIILSVLAATCIAYFVVIVNPVTKEIFDGFGRPLSETPWLLRVTIFSSKRFWAGWGWVIGDMIICGVGMITGWLLVSYSLE
jgi:type II secretory pathway component PulF